MARIQPNTTKKLVLLDVPENVFTEIFKYFKYRHVYLTLRMVCRRIKKYVDSYIQVGGVFFSPNLYQSSRTYIVLKRNHQLISVYCKLSGPYPMPHSWVNKGYPVRVSQNEFADFGLIFNNKILIGIVCTKRIKYSITVTKAGCIQHEYNSRKDTFYQLHEKIVYKNRNERNWWLKGYVTMTSCLVGSSKVLSCFRERYYFGSARAPRPNILLMLDCNIKNYNKSNGSITSLISIIKLPSPLKTLVDFSLVYIRPDKVLLIGGGKSHDHIYDTTEDNLYMWLGTINNEDNDIHWMSLDCKMPKALRNPTCFKLKDNIYIIDHDKWTFKHTNCGNYESTAICNMYNMVTCKYYENVWPLPNSFTVHKYKSKARTLQKPSLRVMTDEKETFAILTNKACMDEASLLFTANDGFGHVPYWLDDEVNKDDRCVVDIPTNNINVIIRVK